MALADLGHDEPPDGEQATLKLWTVRVAVTVAVAALSYNWIERPIRTGTFSGPRVVSVVFGTAAALAAAVIVFPPALPKSLSGGPVTLAGSGGVGSLTILVAGDSWAHNLGYALNLSDVSKRNTFINQGTPGCGLLGQDDVSSCARQQSLWTGSINTDKPDAAVLVEGSVDSDRGTVVNGRRVYPCDKSFDNAYARALDAAIIRLQGGAKIPVYVTTVRDDNTGRTARSDCINSLLRAAATRNSARLADLHGTLCPQGSCPVKHDGKSVYDDTGHLASAGQRWIGTWLLNLIRSQVSGTVTNGGGTGECRDAKAPVRLGVPSYRSQPDPAYPDQAGVELTDGRSGRAAITDAAWQGWQTQTARVTFTLPAVQTICSVRSTWLQALTAAVYIPSEIQVYVSDKPGAQRLLGAAQGVAPSTGTQRATITVVAATPMTARYVTVIVRGTNGWVFADEMALYGPSVHPRPPQPTQQRSGAPQAS